MNFENKKNQWQAHYQAKGKVTDNDQIYFNSDFILSRCASLISLSYCKVLEDVPLQQTQMSHWTEFTRVNEIRMRRAIPVCKHRHIYKYIDIFSSNNINQGCVSQTQLLVDLHHGVLMSFTSIYLQ